MLEVVGIEVEIDEEIDDVVEVVVVVVEEVVVVVGVHGEAALNMPYIHEPTVSS